jgi:transketolase
MIACKTTIGFGAPNKAGTSKATAPLGAEEIAGARKALRWHHRRPFEVPPTSSRPGAPPARRRRRAQGLGSAACWPSQARPSSTAASPATAGQASTPPSRLQEEALIAETPTVATRKASEMALEVINGRAGNGGGSADLTPSNNTKTSQPMKSITPDDFRRPLHPLRHPRARHGRRDERHHAAWRLHPAGGTFMVFSDYAARRCASPR